MLKRFSHIEIEDESADVLAGVPPEERKFKLSHGDTRCDGCGRFIPRGWVIRVDAGRPHCAFHIGLRPLNKATV